MNATTPSESSAISQRAWLMLALVMAVVAFGHFNRLSISSAGNGAIISKMDADQPSDAPPDDRPSTQIDEKQMGKVYSAFLTLYMLFMIPGGWLIDRVGPKWSLAVVCIGSAVFTILTGVVGLIWLVAPPL